MAQITTTDANEFSSSAEFTPMRGFSNCHLQTMLPRLFRRQVKFTPYWQRLELPDGDFVDLAWSEDPAQAKHKPRLVVFHGLEGSLNSPYAHGLVEAAQKRGWLGVVMHFRGCSGEPNRMHRIYHSGETEDASWFLRWLQREFGHAPTAAVGYSLGGNMLACLLAKEGNDLPVDAAVIVSAPFMLEACSYHMEKGFSRVYQRYLLNLLKANAARKLAAYPGTLENLIESFVLREGTDYGEHERTLEQKVADVKRQLQCGEAVLVWSELHETVNIMPRSQFRE